MRRSLIAKPKYHTNLTGYKVCSKCAQAKPFAEFYKRSGRKDGKGRMSACIACETQRHANREVQYKRRWYQARKEQMRRADMERKYGITYEEYQQMHTAQRGLCAICQEPETRLNQNGETYPLAIDHDHTSGKVRGLLCAMCNHGLGNFKDSPDLLRKAGDYLKG